MFSPHPQKHHPQSMAYYSGNKDDLNRCISSQHYWYSSHAGQRMRTHAAAADSISIFLPLVLVANIKDLRKVDI
jgi:hypothetical protein